MPRILPTLIVNIVVATLVTFSHGDLFNLKITLTAIPFSLIGLPIAIFPGFRNNAAYERFWEGRKLWGELVHHSRSFSRQCASLILMGRMGMDLRLCLKEGRIESCLAASVDVTLSAMTATAASCERINNTPIPFSYTLLLHRTAYLYCFLLPFGLVDSIGFMTPFVVAIVAYTFFGLDALSDEIEEPFGPAPNDLPLDAICRAIDIEPRESLHDAHVPAPLTPVNYCLS